MLLLAIAALAVAACATVTGAHLVRSLIRAHARERQLLIDQVCHLAGRPWTPPPADTYTPPDEPVDLGLVRQFDQYPDGYDFAADEVPR